MGGEGGGGGKSETVWVGEKGRGKVRKNGIKGEKEWEKRREDEGEKRRRGEK